MVRAFTLLEITVSVVIVGVLSAIALPSVKAAGDARNKDAIRERAQAVIGAARDTARTHLTCVTVAPIERCDGLGLTTWEHPCPVSATNNPFIADPNGNFIPDEGSAFRKIEQVDMDPALVASVVVMSPGPGCAGTTNQAAPPLSCYENSHWFQYRADGTTTAPFVVRIVNVDGVTHDMVVQPGSGSVRALD